MAEPHAVRRKVLVGSPRPRICPPAPARSGLAAFVAQSEEIGLELYPWQKTAARYLTALGRGDRWLYRHVCIVVARQNGKTKLLVPLIVQRLRAGHRIMHTAQDRDLPRSIHEEVAGILEAQYPDEVAPNRHGGLAIRFASGQEEIRMRNGGRYRIVAPTRSGARGPSNDLVIIDELREMDTHDFIGAANPTLQASPRPQMLYLSNAGDDTSVVLNSIRQSRDTDESLAYLEWSAEPELAADSIEAWVQANPAIGHDETKVENLAADYRSMKARGTLAIFETENICRWVATLRERLVDEYDWVGCRSEEELGVPRSPAIGVSLDPKGTRASVVLAWQVDDKVALRVVRNDTGNPVDVEAIGTAIRELQSRHGAEVGYDPLTDAQLARYVRKGKAIAMSGGKFANASATFVAAIHGRRLQWADADAITDDLTWTARKQDGSSVGSYQAVRAQDDRPITAALAAIRAVKLADGPQSSGPPRIR